MTAINSKAAFITPEAFADRLVEEGEWRAVTDKTSQRMYYFNSKTKERVWNLAAHVERHGLHRLPPVPTLSGHKGPHVNDNSRAATLGGGNAGGGHALKVAANPITDVSVATTRIAADSAAGSTASKAGIETPALTFDVVLLSRVLSRTDVQRISRGEEYSKSPSRSTGGAANFLSSIHVRHQTHGGDRSVHLDPEATGAQESRLIDQLTTAAFLWMHRCTELRRAVMPSSPSATSTALIDEYCKLGILSDPTDDTRDKGKRNFGMNPFIAVGMFCGDGRASAAAMPSRTSSRSAGSPSRQGQANAARGDRKWTNGSFLVQVAERATKRSVEVIPLMPHDGARRNNEVSLSSAPLMTVDCSLCKFMLVPSSLRLPEGDQTVSDRDDHADGDVVVMALLIRDDRDLDDRADTRLPLNMESPSSSQTSAASTTYSVAGMFAVAATAPHTRGIPSSWFRHDRASLNTGGLIDVTHAQGVLTELHNTHGSKQAAVVADMLMHQRREVLHEARIASRLLHATPTPWKKKPDLVPPVAVATTAAVPPSQALLASLWREAQTDLLPPRFTPVVARSTSVTNFTKRWLRHHPGASTSGSPHPKGLGADGRGRTPRAAKVIIESPPCVRLQSEATKGLSPVGHRQQPRQKTRGDGDVAFILEVLEALEGDI